MAPKKEPPSPSKSASPTSLELRLGFLGNHPLNLDEKLRLVIPARYKAILQEKFGDSPEGKTLVVTISPLDGEHPCAMARPWLEWETYIAQLERAPVLDRNSQRLHRLVTSLATPVELDGQGRIRLDKKVAEVAGLKKRVLLVGRGSYFEIWDEDGFNKFVRATMDNVDDISDNAMAHTGATPQRA